MLGAGITGFYMTRLMLMTFFGEKRWEKDVHPHESPTVMTFPLIVLAALSVLGGLMLAGGWIQDFLAPVVGEEAEHDPPIPALAITGLVVLVVAVGVDDRVHVRRPARRSRARRRRTSRSSPGPPAPTSTATRSTTSSWSSPARR